MENRRRYRKLCEGVIFFKIFFFEEGREDPNTTESGPTSACQ